jgi:hypothetical protein
MIKVAVEVVRKSKIGITYFFAEDRDAPGASSATSGSDPRLSPPTPGAVMPGEADLKCLSGAAEQGVAFALFGGMRPGHCGAPISPRSGTVMLVAPYFEALSHLARNSERIGSGLRNRLRRARSYWTRSGAKPKIVRWPRSRCPASSSCWDLPT